MVIGRTVLRSGGLGTSSGRHFACTATFRQFYLRRLWLAIRCSLRVTWTWSSSLYGLSSCGNLCRAFVERQHWKIRMTLVAVPDVILDDENAQIGVAVQLPPPVQIRFRTMCVSVYVPMFIMRKELSQRSPISSRTPITASGLELTRSYASSLVQSASIIVLRKSNCSASVHHFIL